MAQAYLSLTRAKRLVVEIVETSAPGTKNPREENPHMGIVGACLYDDGNGNHCIVGEVLFRMGIPLPYEGGFCFYDGHRDSCRGTSQPLVQKGYMSQATAIWLGQVQERFDARDVYSRGRTWRQALAVCRKDGLF